ncbi:elongin-A-like [Numenius arquata]|uniref:elongin-A-like n=1 Tax=Numenius arquata TaxID=31919 RepID=UPI003D30A57C
MGRGQKAVLCLVSEDLELWKERVWDVARWLGLLEVFRNIPHMSFDDTAREPEQTFSLNRGPTGELEYPTKYDADPRAWGGVGGCSSRAQAPHSIQLLETPLGNAVTEPDTDFEANFQAAWQKLERLCQEALRENKQAEKEKSRDSERGKVEKTKLSLETSQRKRKYTDASKKSTGFSSILGEDEEEEDFKPPTMSFEEYLTYDQPQKKKKKRAVKASVSAGEEEQRHSAHLLCHPSVDSSCSSRQSPSRKRSNEKRAEQEPPEAPKPKRILLDVDIKLPEIPLPPLQASCSPLPAAESIPCSQKKRRAVYSAAEEIEGGFTGRRLYSKTPVFSGLKTARVPRTPSQLCVPVVTSSIDSICEAGGVPGLEPALDRCTVREQLCGAEERHHVLVEDTERLWRNRCLRDFKNEEPKESESWREMYLRLQEAREQRLLKLAQKIGSAQANKGQAAKTMLLASPPKAPRDVRRRQEMFGTGGALVPEKSKTKPVLCASTECHPRVSEKSCDGPSTSSARSVPSSASTFSSWDPRKPPAKKIAPLMAQSVKDFKKRCSQR